MPILSEQSKTFYTKMKKAKKTLKLKENDKLLFIGDSITEAGRDRSNLEDLGQGYAFMIAKELQIRVPEMKLSFINRGVGGDKLRHVKKRWEQDCLELNPDIVTIHIGINDTWHNAGKFTSAIVEEFEQFEAEYRFLLKSLHQRTDARVILMEPYVLPYPKDRVNWREDLEVRIQLVRKMAREYQTELIPLDGLMNAAAIKHGYNFYTKQDGIHPTAAGHKLITKAWLDTID